MFNSKSKSDMSSEKTNGGGATLVAAGTTLKGDISSNNDLRIDGNIIGNISCNAKVVVGANGSVQGDINGNQADIVGEVTGNIKVDDLLQLRGDCIVNGNINAGKLQVEPTATFNGQCVMGTPVSSTVVEMKKNEAAAAVN
jgi:cytoskeletal protein CcmA (bactofilin family)